MHVSRVFALPLVAVAMLPLDTRAAASLMVDDASITDAGRCQLESWGRHTDVGNDWTARTGLHVRRYRMVARRQPSTRRLDDAVGRGRQAGTA